jgi:hypothetical protein
MSDNYKNIPLAEIDGTIVVSGAIDIANVPLPITITGTNPDGTVVDTDVSGSNAVNSTDTPLGANATFTGAWVNVSQYPSTSVVVLSDQSSALNGLQFQWSDDGVDLIKTVLYTATTPTTGLYFSGPNDATWFRVIYTNGSVAQTVFRLQTKFYTTPTSLVVVPLSTGIVDETPSGVVRAVLSAKASGGSYDNIALGQQPSNASLPVVLASDQPSIPVNQNTVVPTISPNFNTFTPLGVGAIFTGAGEDVSKFVDIDVSVISDQASAIDGLVFSWSQDNILYDYEETFSIQPNIGQNYSLAPRAKYFKLSYTNGGVAQGVFQLSTFYYAVTRSTYIQNVDNDIPSGRAADVTKTILSAIKQGGGLKDRYTNLQATSDGILKVTLETVAVPPEPPVVVPTAPVIVQKANIGPLLDQFSLPFPFPVTQNDTIIAVVMQGEGSSGSSYSVNDSQGNVYTRAGGITVNSIGTVDVWYTLNTPSGITAVNIFNSSPPATFAMEIYEVSGLPLLGNPVDQIVTNFSSTPTTSLNSGSLTPVVSDELLISAIAATGSGTITSSVGWTQDLSTTDFLSQSQIVPGLTLVNGFATASSPVTYVGLTIAFLLPILSLPVVTDLSGRLIVNQGIPNTLSNAWPVEITDGTNILGTPSNPVVVSGSMGRTWDLNSATDSVTVSGAVVVGGTVAVSNFPATQAVSGTITANAGTGTFQTDITNPSIAVTGTFFQTTQPVSGTVTVDQGTSPWVVSGTVTTAPNASVGPTASTPPADATYIGGSVTTSAPAYINGQMDPLSLNISGGLRVDGSGVTQPISATSLPLPTGAATAANQTNGTQSTQVTNFPATQVVSGTVAVSNFPATQPVSGTITADQGGVWTTGRTWDLSSGTDSITAIQGTSPWVVSGTVASTQSGTWNIGSITSITNPVAVTGTFWQTTQPVSGTVSVSNFPATQPVSGTITALQGTSPWVVSGTVATTNLSVSPIASTPPADATYIGGSVTTVAPTYTTGQMDPLSLTTAGALRVDGSGVTQPVSGTVAVSNFPATQAVTQSTSPWVVSGTVAATQSGAWTVAATQSGTWNIGTLTSITNPVAVTGTFFQAVQPVSQSGTWTTGRTWDLASGTDSVTVIQGTSPWVTTGTITGTVAVTQSTSPWVVSGTVAATQSGAWTTGRTWDLASGTDSITAFQGGTWTVQPGNTANTTPWLVTVATALPSGTNTIGAVTQGTSPWVVSGTVAISNFPATVAVTQSTSPWVVSQSSTPWLTSDAADGPVAPGTAASKSILTGGQYNTTLPTLTNGQQSAIQVDSSGRLLIDFSNTTIAVTQGTSPWVVSGTVAATQSGTWNIGTLTSITNPVAVTGTFWQTTQPISATSLPLPTGAATSANQTNGTQLTGITGTVAVTQSTSPWVVSGTVSVSDFPAVQAVSQSGTWTVQQGTPPWSVVGTLTNNNAAPAANNVGALTALAEGTLSASRYTTGNLVLPVLDLAGNTNVDLQYYLGALLSKTNPIATTISDGTNVITAAISAYGTAPTGTEVMGVNAFITNIPTVNQGTSPWIVKDQADGPVTPGTVAAFSQLAGGQYNTTAPAPTNGQQVALQVDAGGNLKIADVFGVLTTGSKSAIGTTAVQIDATSVPALSGVTIRSSVSNSATVYIGPSTVTAGTAAATDGIPLTPGESLAMPINNINLVYAIATAAGQEVFWMVI